MVLNFWVKYHTLRGEDPQVLPEYSQSEQIQCNQTQFQLNLVSVFNSITKAWLDEYKYTGIRVLVSKSCQGDSESIEQDFL